MDRMLALLKREWQEHLLGFAWGPVAVLAALVFLTCLGIAVAGFGTATISYSSETIHGEQRSSRHVEIDDSLASLSRFIDFGSWSDDQLRVNMERFRLTVARPFELIYVLIALFVLLGALHDDRRDRSVLFWKSMPVTDAETVLSKLVATVWVAPVAVIAAIVTAQIFLMVVVSGLIWGHELGSVGRLWWHSGLLIGTLELVVGYAVQGLWTLPLYAWLLAVSASVPRVPFVWAVVVPLVPLTVERVAFSSDAIASFVSAHARLAALPRAPGSVDGGFLPGFMQGGGVGLADQLALLFSPQLWLGVIVSAGLLWAAIYFRRRNNDL